MRNFIAYHNRAKMGEHARPFQVYTNKAIRDLQDSVVWIVEGVGRSPKEYNLLSWFIVRKVESSPHAEFKTAGYGYGHEFREKIRLNDFDWFADLRTKMGNFGFGLHPILDGEILRHLEELAARERQDPKVPRADRKSSFSVRCIFRWPQRLEQQRRFLYEERITLWQAEDFDAAVALAEHEARRYAEESEVEYLEYWQAYELPEEIEPHGVEVFSLLRESDFEPEMYLNAFFDTGSERQHLSMPEA